jgi:hypothetical protein
MKKSYGIMILAVAMITGLSFGVWAVQKAEAADLENGIGEYCDAGGDWHFVNVQSEGGTSPLVVYFDTGTAYVYPSAVNKRNTHYYVYGVAGTLLGAHNYNPGKIVLSDLDCGKKYDPKKK